MPVTIEECRAYGMDEATIASMERNGFFATTDPIEDRRDDLTGQIEEVEADLEGWEIELAELLEAISKGKVRLARLRQQLGELPPPAPDDEE